MPGASWPMYLLVSFNWIHNVYACLWIMRKFCWLCEYSKPSASSHRTDYFPTGENFCRVKLSRSRQSFTHTHLFSHTTLFIYVRLIPVRWFAQFYNNVNFSRCRMKWPICFFQFVSFRFHAYPVRILTASTHPLDDDDEEEVVFGARAPLLLDIKPKSHFTFTRTGTHSVVGLVHTLQQHVSKSTQSVSKSPWILCTLCSTSHSFIHSYWRRAIRHTITNFYVPFTSYRLRTVLHRCDVL